MGSSKRSEGSPQGAGAVPSYQGRCLLMILNIFPVTAAVPGRTKPLREIGPKGVSIFASRALRLIRPHST